MNLNVRTWMISVVICSMMHGVMLAVDSTPPTVSIVSPAPDETLSGRVAWRVRAIDEDGGSGVKLATFLIDNTEVAVVTEPADNFDLDWNTIYTDDGTHALTVRAIDRAGNASVSPAVAVRVDNRFARLNRIERPQDRPVGISGSPADTIPPQTRALAPLPGQPVRGQVQFRAWAADNTDGSGIARVEFLVDGAVVGQGAGGPPSYSFAWASAGHDGPHTLTVRATDAAGNVASSVPVAFVADNLPPTFDTNARFVPRVAPTEVNTGQVMVTLYFDGTGSEMDPSVLPTVRYQAAAPAGGGARPAAVNLTQVVYTGRQYIGTTSIDNTVNPGQATISVSGARDRAGNEMAAANNAIQFTVVRINQWPVPAVNAVHSIWHHYGHPIRWSTAPAGGGTDMRPNYFHEGLDLDVAGGTNVEAVETGVVRQVFLDTGATAGYYNMLGVDSNTGTWAFRYMHMTLGNNPRTAAQWALGNAINAGEVIGTVVALPAASNMASHTHFELLNAAGAGAGAAPNWTARGDPLRLLSPAGDRMRPVVWPNFDFRYAEHQSAAAPTFFARPAAGHITINGNVDFVVRAMDRFDGFNRDMPVQRIAWELKDRFKREKVPHTVLVNMDGPYFDSTGNYWNQRQGTRARVIYEFSPAHQTTGGALGTVQNDTECWYTLTNKGGDDLLTLADANRYFNSDVRAGHAWNDLDGAGVDARINKEAAFPDGNGYELKVLAHDEQGNEGTRTDGFNIDNFVPFVDHVIIRQGSGKKAERYDAHWDLAAAAANLALTPANQIDRNPRWINGKEDSELWVVFSEAVDLPRVKIGAGAVADAGVTINVVAGGEDQIYKGVITKQQLSTHKLDGDNVALTVETIDRAGNSLDSDPSTPGHRNAARAFVNADPGPDTNHKLRVDTRSPTKPVPERPQKP